MKRALITVITGHDGSYLAELFLEKGYEVYGIMRRHAEDYVIATNETRTVREFMETAFDHLDISVAGEGAGVHETGRDRASGRIIVKVNPEFFRPAEVEDSF